MRKHIDIVFDGPPSPGDATLVEVEDENGRSIRVGEWIERRPFWVLRLTPNVFDDINSTTGEVT